MIKICLFDLGEVVIDNGFEEVFTRYKEEYNWDIEKLREKIFSRRYELLLSGELTLDDFIDWISKEVDLTRGELEQFAEDYYFAGTPKQKVVEIIKEIKKDCKVGLVTNDIGKLTEKMNYMGISNLFEEVVNSFDLGYCKPSPEFYRAALEKLDLKGKEVVYIDNDQESLQIAEQIGIIPLYFAGHNQLEERLNQLGILVN